ncbi:MAG: hypothetical protein ACI9MC_001216 [Kiritimatiellia bacterium]|jgi:hypothetical protein
MKLRRALMLLRSLAMPLISYWAMTSLGFVLFFGLLTYNKGWEDDSLLILGAFIALTFGGIAAGQVLALLRARSWIPALFTTISWTGVVLFAWWDPPMPDDAEILIFIVLVAAPLFMIGGLWSLRVHMGLLATWVPLMWLTASILYISQEMTGSVENWHAGDKWAIWDVATAPVLFLGVLCMLGYLAARERHRLNLWRFGRKGPTMPKFQRAVVRTGGAAWWRGGCSTFAALIILGIVLTVGTALTAPYLWRTSSDDDGDTSGQTVQGPEEQPAEPTEGEGQPQPGPGQQMQEAIKNAGISLITMLLVLVLALMGLFIFLPPLRRALLLRHLRKPLWPVPPTRQVLQAWRVIEIALSDIGVKRMPGDSAIAMARRAVEALPPDVDHTSLLRCAEVTDRVLFGLGVGPDDPEQARRAAEMTYQTIWDLLNEGARTRAVYRFF